MMLWLLLFCERCGIYICIFLFLPLLLCVCATAAISDELTQAALEPNVPFSLATPSQQLAAAGLGVANLGAVLALGQALARQGAQGVLYASPYLTAVSRVSD